MLFQEKEEEGEEERLLWSRIPLSEYFAQVPLISLCGMEGHGRPRTAGVCDACRRSKCLADFCRCQGYLCNNFLGSRLLVTASIKRQALASRHQSRGGEGAEPPTCTDH